MQGFFFFLGFIDGLMAGVVYQYEIS